MEIKEIKLVVVQDNNNIVKEFKGDSVISDAIDYLEGLEADEHKIKPLVEEEVKEDVINEDGEEVNI